MPLHYTHPHELAIAVILSAQCTDERVNQVTPELFKKYPDLPSLQNARLSDLEQLVFSTGFYKNKSRSIQGFAQKLIRDFNGILPKTIAELVSLPGIGRKTANVILHEIYGVAEGFVVDTHVKRLSMRLGLTQHKDPQKIEKDLMQKFRNKYWKEMSLFLIFLGRAECKAQHTDCPNCVLGDICPTKLYKTIY